MAAAASAQFPSPRPGLPCWLEMLLLGLVVALGIALRAPALDHVPPGLWFDEALDGQDAVKVWAFNDKLHHQEAGFKLVYPDVFPREAIYTSLLAIAVKLGGPEVVVLRSVSVLIGTLTILLLYGMVRSEWGAGPALASSGIMATLRWHVIFSRLIFRTILLGPWLVGITWAALALRRRPHPGKAVLLGALLGGGFYTYLTWYFMAPWLLALVGWLAWHARRRRLPWRHLGLVAVVALITFAPLGMHYVRAPQDLLARPEEVSVFKDGPVPAFKAIAKNTLDAVLMFHLRGDHVPKHNIPLESGDKGGHYGRPALDMISRIGFVLGLLLCGMVLVTRQAGAWQPPRALCGLLPLWIGCALLSTIFTVTDSPNFLRTLCATPAVAALAGMGWWVGLRLLSQTPAAGGKPILAMTPVLRGALVGALILTSGALTARAVYRDWPTRMDVWQNFNGDIFDIAMTARRPQSGNAVYVPQFLYEHRTFQFLLLSNPNAANVRPYHDFSFLDPFRTGTIEDAKPRWVVTTAHNRVHEALRQLVPGARVVHEFKAPAGNTYALIMSFKLDDLPSSETVRLLQKSWRGELAF